MLIVLGIIWVILIIAVFAMGFFPLYEKEKGESKSATYLVLFVLMIWAGFILADLIGERNGSIKTLKGTGRYTMEIRYTLQDSVITPVDTLYIRK